MLEELYWEKPTEEKVINPTPCTACHLSRTALTKGISCSRMVKVDHFAGFEPEPPVLFVGEAPGPTEDKLGTPFIGPSGQFLRNKLSDAGIPANRVIFSNVVQCVPWANAFDQSSLEVRPPSMSEMFVCSARLLREIQTLKPVLIVSLGGISTWFLKFFGAPGSAKPPALKKVNDVRAEEFFIRIAGEVYPVWSTYHPAAVLRNSRLEHLFECDLQNASMMLKGQWDIRPKTRIPKNTDEALAMLQEVLDWWNTLSDFERRDREVMCDIESSSLDPNDPDSYVLGISLSFSDDFDPVYIPLVEHGEKDYVYVPDIDPDIVTEKIREVFSVVPVGNQNVKFDYKWWVQKFGVESIRISSDPMIYAHLTHGEKRYGENSIKALQKDLCHIGPYDDVLDSWFKEHNGGKKEFAKLPFSLLAPYAGLDAWGARKVKEKLSKYIDLYGLIFPARLSVAAAQAFAEIEMAGIAIEMGIIRSLNKQFHDAIIESYYALLEDPKVIRYLDQLDKEAGQQAMSWRQKLNALSKDEQNDHEALHKILGFNPGSASDVAKIIFDFYRVGFSDEWKTASGKKSVAEGVLKKIKNSVSEKDPDSPVAGFISKVLKYRSAVKIRSNYVDKLSGFVRKDGTLNVNYQITGTRTGRLSTTSFSVHTIPRKGRADVKRAFVSRWKNALKDVPWSKIPVNKFPHYTKKWMTDYPKNGGGLIISADYSQLELRVLAAVSKDPGLIEAFDKGQDLHRYVAARITFPDLVKLPNLSASQLQKIFVSFARVPEFESKYAELNGITESVVRYLVNNPDFYEAIRYAAVTDEQRAVAKAISFGIVYGSSAKSIAAKITYMTLEDVEAFFADYFQTFPGVLTWIEEQHARAVAKGSCRTPTHRIRWLFNAKSNDRSLKNADMRISQNTPVQGSASDICVMAIVLLRLALKQMGMRSLVCASVHDSILTDVYPRELLSVLPLVRQTMEKSVVEQPGFKDWLSVVKIVADQDLCVSWGGGVSVKSVEGNQIRLYGSPGDVEDVTGYIRKSYSVLEAANDLVQTPDGQKMDSVLVLT